MPQFKEAIVKYITIQKRSVIVSDELYTKIKSQDRYEERLVEKTSSIEVLIQDETELDNLKNRTEESPYDVLEKHETFIEIMKIINTQLTAKERYILTSVYLDSKKQYEVANELDLTVDQVRYLLKATKKKVRELYDRIN